MLKEKEDKKTPEAAGAFAQKRQPVKAGYPNHVWQVDLTVAPTSWGFWTPWFPFSIPQSWPFCWWMGLVVDHFSRRVMGYVLFAKEPNSQDIQAFLGRTISQNKATPKYIISDKGGQFSCGGFEDWCDRKGIIPRYSSTGRKNATAVIERFFRTMKEVLFSPTLFFRNMPVNKGIQNPLLYGVIIGFVGGLLNLLWQYAFSGVLGTINVFLTAYVLIYAFALPFLIAIGLFVFSGVFHVVLMVVGGDKRGFEATFRVVSYSTSTQVLSLLPLLGWLIAPIYSLVLFIIGFRESHRIGTGRAAFAVLLPLILVTVLILIVIFMILLPLITSQTQMMMQRPPTF